jgi:hypothetical protein
MNYGKNKNVTGHPPNKPMVPTATRALAEPALLSGRRHIGEPMGLDLLARRGGRGRAGPRRAGV